MNSNWRNRPTTIDYISKDIDWIVAVDESGTPNLKRIIKAKNEGIHLSENEQHFTVTATVIKAGDFDTARDMIMELKNKHWENALFEYKGSEKRVCFHSRDIRGRREAFNSEVIDYDLFIKDLSQLMKDIPMTLYASHIDKVAHVGQYRYPLPVYDLCITFVLERIVRDIGPNKSCIIVLESRGKNEDKALLDHIKKLVDYGSKYCPASAFKRIKGVYFNPKWCAEADDKKSYWELELADLCAYPIQKYFVYGTKDKAFQTLVPKISCYPSFWGKGLKSFP